MCGDVQLPPSARVLRVPRGGSSHRPWGRGRLVRGVPGAGGAGAQRRQRGGRGAACPQLKGSNHSVLMM